MVLYECFRCGYKISHRGNFKNHLNRKKICNPLLEDCSIEYIKEYYKFEIIPNSTKIHQNPPNIHQKLNKNIHQNPPKSTKINENIHQNPPKSTKKIYKCNFCNEICSRSDSLKRHYTRCKKKKESEQIVLVEKDKLLEMENKIEKLENELKKNNTNITNNTNNTNNITNNNIIINNIGEENTKYLKSLDFANLLQGIYGAVPKLIEQIHFNPEYPENQNIKYPNKKNPYLKIMKNNKWQLVNKKPELLDLIDSKYFLLKEKYYNILEKTQYKLNDFQKERINKFIDKYQEEDKEIMLDLINRTELVLLNNS